MKRGQAGDGSQSSGRSARHLLPAARPNPSSSRRQSRGRLPGRRGHQTAQTGRRARVGSTRRAGELGASRAQGSPPDPSLLPKMDSMAPAARTPAPAPRHVAGTRLQGGVFVSLEVSRGCSWEIQGGN